MRVRVWPLFEVALVVYMGLFVSQEQILKNEVGKDKGLDYAEFCFNSLAKCETPHVYLTCLWLGTGIDMVPAQQCL